MANEAWIRGVNLPSRGRFSGRSRSIWANASSRIWIIRGKCLPRRKASRTNSDLIAGMCGRHAMRRRAWRFPGEAARVALPWESTLGFLRVVTNPRIYAQPATIARAWWQVTEWLSCGNVWIPHAGVGAWPGAGRAIEESGGWSEACSGCAFGGARDRAWVGALFYGWGLCAFCGVEVDESAGLAAV